MTRKTAKRITLPILDRWTNLSARQQAAVGLRFVVLKNRHPVPGREDDTGYVFSDRQQALVFAESHYRGDFAMFALTERGSVDITPE